LFELLAAAKSIAVLNVISKPKITGLLIGLPPLGGGMGEHPGQGRHKKSKISWTAVFQGVFSTVTADYSAPLPDPFRTDSARDRGRPAFASIPARVLRAAAVALVRHDPVDPKLPSGDHPGG
jgi:hypothetical protein